MIYKCYFSEKLIALNTFHDVVNTWYSFYRCSTEALQIKCLAQGHSILLPGFEPSTSSSRNRHSSHMTNVLLISPNMLIQHTTRMFLKIWDVGMKETVWWRLMKLSKFNVEQHRNYSSKCGFPSRLKTCSICAQYAAHVNSVCAFACPLLLRPERVVASRVSLSSVSYGCPNSCWWNIAFQTCSL